MLYCRYILSVMSSATKIFKDFKWNLSKMILSMLPLHELSTSVRHMTITDYIQNNILNINDGLKNLTS